MKMRVILVEDEETTMAAPTPTPSKCCEYTLDGSVDIKNRPAVKGKSGGWLAGGLILGTYDNSAAQPFLPFLLYFLLKIWRERKNLQLISYQLAACDKFISSKRETKGENFLRCGLSAG